MSDDADLSLDGGVLWLVREPVAGSGTAREVGAREVGAGETRRGGCEAVRRGGGEDRGRFGSKGVGLARLVEGGWPVPEGFVLSTAVFRAWRNDRREWPVAVRQLVRQALGRLERWGWTAETLLAVRSGARRSHPGLLRTCLGVPAVVDDVLAAMTRVCESVESLEVRRAREWPGSQTPTETAIVVQRFIDTECAGVLFTADPHQPSTLLVEAVAGLGERLVAGEVVPHRWRLTRLASGGEGAQGSQAGASGSSAAGSRAVGSSAVGRVPGGSAESGPPTGVGASRAGGPGSSVAERSARGELASGASTHGGRPHGALAGSETVCGEAGASRAAEAEGAAGAGLAEGMVLESPAGPLPAALATFARGALGELSSLALRLEGEWGEPLDLEWGVKGSQIWLLQARPAGGGGAGDEPATPGERVAQRLRELGEAGREIWVRHNLADSLPNPTPLSLALWRQFLSPAGGYGRLYRTLGYRPASGVAGGSLVELIGGEVYLDAGQLPGWSCRGFPLGVDLARLLREPGGSEAIPLRLDLEGLDRWLLVRWPWVAWVLARARRRQARLGRTAERDFQTDTLPRWENWLRAAGRQRLTNATPERLCGEFERLRRGVFDQWGWRLLLPGTLGVLAWRRVHSRLVEWLGNARAAEVAGALLGSVPDPVTTAQRSLAARYERGECSAEALRAGLGHRAGWEFDLSVARWGEGATARELAERVVGQAAVRGAGSGATPGKARAEGEAEREARDREQAAFAVLREGLQGAGAGSLLGEVEGDWRVAWRLLPYRGLGRDAWLRGWELLRGVVVELGRVTGWEDDVHFLVPEELRRLVRDRDGARDRDGERARLAREIERRRQRHWAVGRMGLPPVLLAPQLEERLRHLGWPAVLGTPTEKTHHGLEERPGRGADAGATGAEGLSAPGGETECGESSRGARVLSPGGARGKPWIYERSLPGRVTPGLGLSGAGSDLRECPAGAIVVARHVGAAEVPSLGRVAGLVVEVGGALSHVALVARQLRLPVLVVEGAVDWARGARELVLEQEPARVVRVGGGR